MDTEMIALGFLQHYYNIFDSNRAALEWFYHDASRLNFEGQTIQGVQNIVNFLNSLPLQCSHHISTIDCQPTSPTGGFVVFVSGTLQVAGELHPRKFNQMFHLMPAWGRVYVLNDIFRLN
ncbi:hypothetical protein UlMin_039780 [Ulmus minor]